MDRTYGVAGNFSMLLVILALGGIQSQNCLAKINSSHVMVHTLDRKIELFSLSRLISGPLVQQKCNVYLEENLHIIKFRLLKSVLFPTHHQKVLPTEKVNQMLADALFNVYQKALAANLVYIVSDEQNINRNLAALLGQDFLKNNQRETNIIKKISLNVHDLLNIEFGMNLLKSVETHDRGVIFMFVDSTVVYQMIRTLHKQFDVNGISLLWVVPFDRKLSVNDIPIGIISYQMHKPTILELKIERNKNNVSNSTEIHIRRDYLSTLQITANSRIQMFILLTSGWKEVYLATLDQNGTVLDTINAFVNPELFGMPIISKKIKIVSILSSNNLFERHDSYVKEKCVMKDTIPCLIPSQKSIRILNSTKETNWRNSCCAGYMADLIQLLEKKLFFKASLYIVEDGKYGSVDSNGKGVGMIGDVYHRKAAIAIAQLTINSQREKYVDFTMPFSQDSLGILKRKPNFDNGTLFNFELIIPFHLKTVAIIFGVLVVSTILIFVTEHFIFSKTTPANENKLNYCFMSCLLYTCGIFFGRDIAGKLPKSTSSLIFVCFLAFGLLAISTMYTASLTANLVVVENDFIGFLDPKIQNPSNQFKFTTQKDTSIEQYFKFSESARMRRIYHFMKQYLTPRSRQAISKVLNREMDGYIDEYSYLKRVTHKHCELEVYPIPHVPNPHGIAITKNSTLVSIVSQALIELLESGEIARLELKWRREGECETTLYSRKLSLRLFAASFLLLGAGMLTSVLIFLIQCCVRLIRRVS